LIVNNHTFKCNKTTKKKIYWRCDEVENCNIWVQTTLGGVYINMNKSEHDHFCDPDRVVIKKLIGVIRERCKQELISLTNIYEQEVKNAKLTKAQLCRMPRYDQLQPSLSRLRLSLLPPLPSDLEFIIPNKYSINIDGERFLLKDLSNQKRFKRLLIFASDRLLNFLFQSEWLFIDGTFKTAPSMFTQLVCIIGFFEGQAITLCYALLDGKHTDGYRAIISTLKDEAKRRGTVLMPTFVMTDFEGGLIKAVAAEFPAGTRHVGCYFHHCQSIYRMISTIGLKTAYETKDNVRELCKKLMAIALMPIDEIEDAFLQVSKDITQENFTDPRRAYPTVAKTLDPIIKEWFSNVNCGPDEKVFYKTIKDVGTRSYFVERTDGGKSVLKVQIQSTDKKQSKKWGCTFEVLSSHDELNRVLSDALESLRDKGKPLEAARYYRKLSEHFDIGRDRLKDSIDYDNDENHEEKAGEDNSVNGDSSSNASKPKATKEPVSVQCPVLTKKTKRTKSVRKRAASELMDRSPLSQPTRLNRTLENLTLWNNETAAFKIMPPLDRKQRRAGFQRNQ
ncbi:unnamed protein product, partial [Rotaria sp. Silwood2]